MPGGPGKAQPILFDRIVTTTGRRTQALDKTSELLNEHILATEL